ncbi:MAG: glycosyltransferase [Thermomicrobiales bacterium]|nr:glycosyltransferase [Thermomicrobiales bacterium]
MAPPLLSIVYVTGDRDPLPALETSIANNRRDDIEWVVVDNRAAPGAQPEEVAGSPVRWISAPAGDGNAALNRGAAAALGLIVLPLLAGDELYTGAVSRLINEWRQIPSDRKARFSGITALADTGGGVREFRAEWTDLEPAQLRYQQGWAGEPLYTLRVELLRARPLPLPGDPLPPLAMLWRVASRGFMTRAINAELATRQPPERQSARNRRYEALSILSFDIAHSKSNRKGFRDAAADYQIASTELNIGLRRQWRDLKEDAAKALWLTTWLPGRKRERQNALKPGQPAVSGAPNQIQRGPVLFIVSSLDPPVAGQLAATAIGLQQRQAETRVISLDAGALERDLRDAGIAPVLLEPHPVWDFFGLLREIKAHIARAKPAVIASAGAAPNLAVLLLKRWHKARIVWTLAPAEAPGLSDRIAAFIECRLARFVSATITSNQADFDQAIATGFPRERLTIVPAGLDLERFRHDPEGRASHRAAWRVSDRAPLIGRIGRIVPAADHTTFLQAAVIVGRTRPEARFVCIGGGPNARVAEMQALSRALGLGERVIWTGAITTSASVYSALDLCVSSAAEANGIPESIAEAMACGTPVIATDAGESAWLIGDDRAIVPVGDPEALAARILAFLDDQDAGLSDPATLRARVARELSVERLLDRMEQVLYG